MEHCKFALISPDSESSETLSDVTSHITVSVKKQEGVGALNIAQGLQQHFKTLVSSTEAFF